MEDKEYETVYAIPANYTDSGKLFGGMLEPRNAIETVVLALLLGYPELILIPMPGTVRVIVVTLTILPVSVASMMGIDGYSLFQYLGHIFRYLKRRRKLHFRRAGYPYDTSAFKEGKEFGRET